MLEVCQKTPRGEVMTDQEPPKTKQELMQTAVGVIASSVAARSIDNMDSRIQQYGHDFDLLVSDMTVRDLVRMTSLLADINGFMVDMLARQWETSPEEVMQKLALKLLDTQVTEDEIE